MYVLDLVASSLRCACWHYSNWRVAYAATSTRLALLLFSKGALRELLVSPFHCPRDSPYGRLLYSIARPT